MPYPATATLATLAGCLCCFAAAPDRTSPVARLSSASKHPFPNLPILYPPSRRARLYRYAIPGEGEGNAAASTVDYDNGDLANVTAVAPAGPYRISPRHAMSHIPHAIPHAIFRTP